MRDFILARNLNTMIITILAFRGLFILGSTVGMRVQTTMRFISEQVNTEHNRVIQQAILK